jgi:hypothetical protein
MRKFLLWVAAVAVAFAVAPAFAAPAVKAIDIGGSRAVLLLPAQPKASVILMPGGDGRIRAGADGGIHRLRNNQLVRTRFAYAARGLAVLVVDADVNLAAAVRTMRRIKSPVTVIATSRGTLRAAQGIAAGARPDALVLTAGFLTNESGNSRNVANILGSPAKLPRTLVIHHRRDGCHVTRPAGVAPFIEWSRGRARVVWLDGGSNAGNPCMARAHHGFAGLDARVVSLAARVR